MGRREAVLFSMEISVLLDLLSSERSISVCRKKKKIAKESRNLAERGRAMWPPPGLGSHLLMEKNRDWTLGDRTSPPEPLTLA